MWENACRIKLFNCNVLHRLHPKNEKNSGNELFSVPVLMTKSSENIWHQTSHINRKPAFQVGILNCRISRFDLESTLLDQYGFFRFKIPILGLFSSEAQRPFLDLCIRIRIYLEKKRTRAHDNC